MRNKIFQAQMNGMAFALAPKYMSALMEMANTETPRLENSPTVIANNSVEYQKLGDTAVISIEGGMYKKDMSGMCMSVASYDQMVKAIDRAEADNSVKTMLFRVDTGGGAVDGADEVGERIFNSSKKTITFYENMGASGGIWVFSASDEVYASETTMLGSIGVVVSYMEDNEEEGKRIDIVSKNAENKRCSLNGDCKDKIQSMLDSYEDIFYARVMRNTGFSANKIKSVFNSGGMIFAKQAEENGFIKEVTTFDKLIKSINMGSTLVPSVSVNTTNIIQGADMTFDRNDLDATEALFNTLVANKTTMDNRNDTLKVELQTVTTALEAKTEEMTKLEASHTEKLSEAEGKIASAKEETETRIGEAVASKVSVEVALKMVQADTAENASKIALEAKQSDGGTFQTEVPNEDNNLQARCDTLNVTFVK